MKVLIIDREELFRLSLKEVIRIAVKPNSLFEASSERDLLDLTTREQKLDLIMINRSSLGAIEQEYCDLIRRFYPGATFLVINESADNSQLIKFHGFQMKVRYLNRAQSIYDMIGEIRQSVGLSDQVSGDTSFADCIQAFDLRSVISDDSSAQVDNPDLKRLSFRQKQILVMAANGLSNKNISTELTIAEGTVKAHMHAIFKILCVSNRTEAVLRSGFQNGPQRWSQNEREAFVS